VTLDEAVFILRGSGLTVEVGPGSRLILHFLGLIEQWGVFWRNCAVI
jgi:hypothetical protein